MTTCNKNLDELSIEELQKLFERQSEEIKSIESMSNDDKLYLYKYYKQSTIGNINIEIPSFFDFIGHQKYNAWKSVEYTSSSISMKKYILHTYNLL
jgi:diazepam-binding inhibitor (GABA receptor modulator, acyl-CoA-binding protein)